MPRSAAVTDEGLVDRALDARSRPRARLVAAVAPGLGKRPLGNAQVKVGHHQLRDLGAQGRARARRDAGRLQNFVGFKLHARERHAAAIGLALPESIPVREHLDPRAAGGHGANQRGLARPMPRRDGQDVRADRPGAVAFLAIEPIGAVALGVGYGAAVERVQGIAPEQTLLPRCPQVVLLLGCCSIKENACDLQMVKAEQVCKSAVDFGQTPDDEKHGGPVPTRSSMLLGNRQQQQSAGAQEGAFFRRMAPAAVPLDRRGGKPACNLLDSGPEPLGPDRGCVGELIGELILRWIL